MALFSSNVPYLKVRMDRGFGVDGEEYTKRQSGIGADRALTIPGGNKNPKIHWMTDNLSATNPMKLKLAAFSNSGDTQTTLGGDYLDNVNVSMDGTTPNVEGHIGDFYTLTEII